ncbi:DUF748 domain-containing protein [Mariniflexile litorale]|uniref:DUF748 domain-containing protein n=1 Tax=Mariniflexile litorale TaxID=3045158 RepID=A0AAU7EHU9_9FLAO|nr:DUF748 domain-containing protein [Mariniflexile sp. KMM 9835]MDQ8211907.1 DUF748 domain-containing protein [Mariniflexile sp. KMM 9835]
MTPKKKKNIKVILFLVFIFLIGFIVLHLWAKNYIDNFLKQKAPEPYAISYSDLDINILTGSVALQNASLKIKDTDTLENNSNLKLESLQLSGISYWDLLFNEKLSINNIHLKNPKLNHYPYEQTSSKKTASTTNKKSIKTINIQELTIKNGSFNSMQQTADSIKFSVSSYNLTILGSEINLNSSARIPLTYEGYKLNAKNIILGHTKYETFKISSINSNKEATHIKNFQIVPKYNKKELSTHLSKERDYIKLTIPEINLDKLDFNYTKDRFGIKTPSVKLVAPNLEVYRDKLLPDDLTVKSLYSKSLRNLSFNLDLEELKISDGYISYAELVDANNEAGKLFFSQVDATLSHITNLKEAEKTDIKIQSKLMDKAPLNLNWSFDVNNKTDDIEVSGSLNNLPAEILNPFFKPNLNALTEGTLQKLYFTFYGNNIQSQGEMKMKYEDFKFEILQKNGFKINKVLTTIGNIFINDGSNTDAEGFRFGNIKAEREVTKSFFNYLWINVKSGLVSTLTGDGEK